jgi:hypothetical protein
MLQFALGYIFTNEPVPMYTTVLLGTRELKEFLKYGKDTGEAGEAG